MDPDDIPELFAQLIDCLNAQIIKLRESAAEALHSGDYQRHDAIYEKLKEAGKFVERVTDLKVEWEEISSVSKHNTEMMVPSKTHKPAGQDHQTEILKLKNSNRKMKSSGTSVAKGNFRVIMPDGTVIRWGRASRTMVEVIERIGVERVFNLYLGLRGGDTYPLISRRPIDGQHPHYSGGYYIHTHCSTDEKIKKINEIGRRLGLNIRCEILS